MTSEGGTKLSKKKILDEYYKQAFRLPQGTDPVIEKSRQLREESRLIRQRIEERFEADEKFEVENYDHGCGD